MSPLVCISFVLLTASCGYQFNSWGIRVAAAHMVPRPKAKYCENSKDTYSDVDAIYNMPCLNSRILTTNYGVEGSDNIWKA